MLRSLELRFRGHSFAEQLALSRRIRLASCRCASALARSASASRSASWKGVGSSAASARAFLDLVSDVHVASDHPAEHLKTQDGFVTGFNRSGETPLLLPLPARQSMLSTGRIGGAGAAACRGMP